MAINLPWITLQPRPPVEPCKTRHGVANPSQREEAKNESQFQSSRRVHRSQTSLATLCNCASFHRASPPPPLKRVHDDLRGACCYLIGRLPSGTPQHLENHLQPFLNVPKIQRREAPPGGEPSLKPASVFLRAFAFVSKAAWLKGDRLFSQRHS